MQDRFFAYAVYALAVLSFMFALASGSAVLLLLVAVLLFMSSVYAGASGIINRVLLPALAPSLRMREGQYALAPGGSAAIVRQGQVYMAISALSLSVLKPGSESKIGEALSSASVDMDYVVSIRHIDAHRFMEGLELKHRLKELEIAKLGNSSYAKLSELRHELEVIEGELSAVAGSKPVQASFTIKVFASAQSPRAAANDAFSNAEGIANVLGAVSGISASVLKGDELLEVLSC
ncbi:MAG: hypothetical protein ACP5T3_01105 [Candidatus Micrarchaeia archaeon]